MKTPSTQSSNPAAARSENIRRQLSRLVDTLELDARQVNDARFRKLVMKSAEVLENLRTLFERFAGEEQPAATKAPRTSSKAGESKPAHSSAGSDKRTEKPSKSGPASRTGKTGGSMSTTQTPAAETTPAEAPSNSSAPTLPAAAPKPQDPDEIAAKARLQRMAARAPKRPGGKSAPRPLPPKSGKPVWSQPHSS